MPTYCGEITDVGAITGGGYVATGTEHPDGTVSVPVGAMVRIATEISRLEIGGTVLEKVRVCVAALAYFVRRGDHACVFVYGHLLRKQVIIGVRSTTGPSWTLPFGRFVTMMAVYALVWPLIIGLPAVLGATIVGGFFGPGVAGLLARLAMYYAIGISWWSGIRLYMAYREMQAAVPPARASVPRDATEPIG